MKKHFSKRDLIEKWFDEEENQVDSEIAWDDLLLNLQAYLNKINPVRYWKVSVKNFGWRSLDGKKIFHAETSKEFLGAILPNCDCHFNIYKNGKHEIAIQNYHHDSPTGNEWYYIYPITEKEFKDVDC
jgi:hypothetical protein